mmetsp:Transcript_29/g.37  ORF Transcript_29/g.37 Transcript_29/m.37 type:complete len:80 (+) Transcript_29:77-316(+)
MPQKHSYIKTTNRHLRLQPPQKSKVQRRLLVNKAKPGNLESTFRNIHGPKEDVEICSACSYHHLFKFPARLIVEPSTPK